MNICELKVVTEIAEGLNEEYAGAVCEPDVNYWPPNTLESCMECFLEDVAKAFPDKSFDEAELRDLFSEVWTGVVE